MLRKRYLNDERCLEVVHIHEKGGVAALEETIIVGKLKLDVATLQLRVDGSVYDQGACLGWNHIG